MLKTEGLLQYRAGVVTRMSAIANSAAFGRASVACSSVVVTMEKDRPREGDRRRRKKTTRSDTQERPREKGECQEEVGLQNV